MINQHRPMLIYRFIGLLAQAGADLSVYRFIGLSAQAGADLSVYRFIGAGRCRFVRLSVYRFIGAGRCRFVRLSVYRRRPVPICPFIGLSAQAGADLSVYRFIGAGRKKPAVPPRCIFQYKIVSEIGRVRSPKRRVRDDDFILGLSSNRLSIGGSNSRSFRWSLELTDFVAGAVFAEVRGWLCLLRAF